MPLVNDKLSCMLRNAKKCKKCKKHKNPKRSYNNVVKYLVHNSLHFFQPLHSPIKKVIKAENGRCATNHL